MAGSCETRNVAERQLTEGVRLKYQNCQARPPRMNPIFSTSEYILRVVFYGLLFVFGTALFLYKNDFSFHQIKTRAKELIAIVSFGILIILNVRSFIRHRKDDICSNSSLKGDAAKARCAS